MELQFYEDDFDLLDFDHYKDYTEYDDDISGCRCDECRPDLWCYGVE